MTSSVAILARSTAHHLERLERPEGPACEDCGAPGTHLTSDGVWLCESDWQRLLWQWAELSEDEREAFGG